MRSALPLPSALIPGDLDARKAELREPYERYVTEVSTPGWAASLEVSSFLLHLCDTLEVKSVLEYGSGFTSYVFRRFAASRGQNVRVISTDNDTDWLGKTASFLKAEGMTANGLFPLEEVESEIAGGKFDLVFQDIFGGIRDSLASTAVDHLAPGGLLLLDDANRPSHRRVLQTAAGSPLYDCRPWTRDGRGRWSVLVIRPPIP